jgi:hypothetical protein
MVRFVLLLFLLLVPSGCGSGENAPAPRPTGDPGQAPSCETLQPQLLEDPSTGGAFHCLWCNRQWKWTVARGQASLFVVIAVVCEALGSEASLEIRDAQGLIAWQQPIEQGLSETYCIRQDKPLGGTYSVGLYGQRDFLSFRDLIEEFRGSIYLKIFDERGNLLLPSAG